MQRVIFQTAFSGGIKVLGAGLTFLMFMCLARAMSAEEYGRFAQMFSIGNFCALIALMGQHTRVLKRLSAALEVENHAAARSVFWQSWWVVILFGSLVCVLLIASAPLLAAFSFGFDIWILIGAACFILPFAFAELAASNLRVVGALLWALVPRDILWRGGVVVMALAISASLLPALTAMETMAIISGMLLFFVLGQILRIGRALPPELQHRQWPQPDREIWTESAWLWAASLVGVIGANLSVVVVGLLLSTVESGAFFAATKISQLLHLPTMAVSVVATPAVARLIQRNAFQELQVFCRGLVIILSVSALGGALIICAAPTWILSLLNPEFGIASTALLILTASYLVTSLCGTPTILMLMSKGERKFVWYQGLFDGLGILLIFPLLPLVGLEGAALGLLLGKIGWNVAAVRWCRRELGVDPSIWVIFRRPGGAQGTPGEKV
ncbi:lipopolysaccharide biosynthesis protein [Tritonibacter horizontis]|uniref:Polysaccharide biosynthesis protein n=1 Tax=Tritonibacter horizontis TaxID=1768241 RepID=A0A132C0C1_9RHOB|nr:oligosaccharide flippase family protein [Tritonibacter horizontis]KUP93537.1 polysaccharide biosynthesis protein [Tritonibacter horizontis]